MVIKIGQVNEQRSPAAAANLEMLMKERNQDILCVQEPFCFKEKVRGYNASNLANIQPQNCEKPWVATVVKNDKLDVLTRVGSECEHIMCFKVITGDSVFAIINAYCQYSFPLEGFLEKIERIISSFQTEKVLVTMDSNARSELCFDKITDDKGILLEEFIFEHDFAILNKPNNPPTFMGGNGESNIDVPLATRNMIRYVKAWMVDTSCTTSDHNLVIIEIDENNNCDRNWKPDHGYNVRKADWLKFGRSVEQNFSDDVLRSLSTLPVEKAVKVFNEKLDKCCKCSITEKKNGRTNSTMVELATNQHEEKSYGCKEATTTCKTTTSSRRNQ